MLPELRVTQVILARRATQVITAQGPRQAQRVRQEIQATQDQQAIRETTALAVPVETAGQEAERAVLEILVAYLMLRWALRARVVRRADPVAQPVTLAVQATMFLAQAKVVAGATEVS